MAIYQMLIAIRSGNPNMAATVLTNADGETTSHIQGIFNRTIKFITEGIRPVYVFDGKPPAFKSGELLKRREKREKVRHSHQLPKKTVHPLGLVRWGVSSKANQSQPLIYLNNWLN